ncbi:MAG: hypothetical protein K2M87_02105 [Muribaculaceae bacterium]|nr:hypothetical protein [Muribaculaceae bacterium]
MTPLEVYNKLLDAGATEDYICNLHSACSPAKEKPYLCGSLRSSVHVIDFDAFEWKIADAEGRSHEPSVDAVALPEDKECLLFVELKSWEMVLRYHGTEEQISNQAEKYKDAFPRKLLHSMQLCREICESPDALNDCRKGFVFMTDIPTASMGIEGFFSDMETLAATATPAENRLKDLCRDLGKEALAAVTGINTYYWECRDFDRQLSRF